MKKVFLLLIITMSMVSCHKETKTIIALPVDYNTYLNTNNTPGYDEALSQNEFWSKRLDADTTGVGELGPLAGTYAQLFAATGDAKFLSDAEAIYKKAITISANNKDGFTRGLARNYISQHRFKEAIEILEESYAGPSKKRDTEYIMFDVYMELGEYEKADNLLGKLKNNSDFPYLIRLAKWNDHKGNLDAAIRTLEKARDIAESRGSKPLKVWAYSNIGDFYGHAGRIEDAYNSYLKTLALEPDNAYAKKGIAWILYSHQYDTVEANRILDSVIKKHHVPDYFLLKAEMAEYNNDTAEATKQNNNFIKAVHAGNYGDMYNTYLIELYTETDPKKALEMAENEVSHRATPETYQLLAYAMLQAGKKKEALQIIEEHVEGKTFEPMAQYHAALIYKANGLKEKVSPIKEELEEASFEIGPVLTKNVKNL